MGLASREMKMKRMPVCVAQQMDFARKAAARTA